MDEPRICVRCGLDVVRNRENYETFERMHWLCFHYEFEHGGGKWDPDEACLDPSCPARAFDPNPPAPWDSKMFSSDGSLTWNDLQSRQGDNRWVRFHSLPGSKRYADNEADYACILSRHNVVIGELLKTHEASSANVLVFCSTYSDRDSPSDSWLDVPGQAVRARYRSSDVHDDSVADGTIWEHKFVFEQAWTPGCLDGLLRHVADDECGGPVAVTVAGFEWVYRPYDGGADVVLQTPELRNEIADRHGDWRPVTASGL